MIKIMPMKETCIPDAVKLWEAQFGHYCLCGAFPDFRAGGRHLIESYIADQIRGGNAIVAIKDNSVIGYMAWTCFDFHSERTAFLPITGHAASLNGEIGIYEEMYYHAAQAWVQDDRFNHLWMTYFDDTTLKDRLYDLGFGSYVIDACQSTACSIKPSCDCAIRLAAMEDVDALLKFANTSTEFYHSSPIFLKRSPHTREEIMEMTKNDYALLALDKGNIVGFLSFSVHQDFHFEHLTTPDSAGHVGAYIDPNYRKQGIGTALIARAIELCREKGKQHIHVSFESANPNAIRFWPKYFKPAIRSVRRTINKDANQVRK